MANHHTAWHVLFVAGLSEHGPPGFEILPEFLLSKEPLRADVVVVRRREGPHHDDQARTLRDFWPHVRDTGLIEFKSLSRPLRPGELAKLYGYGGQYHALCFDKLDISEDLLLVLVVSSITPTLIAELEALRLTIVPVGRGYARAEAAELQLHPRLALADAAIEDDVAELGADLQSPPAQEHMRVVRLLGDLDAVEVGLQNRLLRSEEGTILGGPIDVELGGGVEGRERMRNGALHDRRRGVGLCNHVREVEGGTNHGQGWMAARSRDPITLRRRTWAMLRRLFGVVPILAFGACASEPGTVSDASGSTAPSANSTANPAAKVQRGMYVAIGDSFTIGTGSSENDAFPARLVARLDARGIAMELTNLGVNGFRTDDLLAHELPRVAALKPTLVTLAVGANDIVRGSTLARYRSQLRRIFAELSKAGVAPARVITLPQPDWSKSEAAASFGEPSTIYAEIRAYNAALAEESRAWGARYVDLWPLMEQQAARRLIAFDGLHPSAEAHDAWAAALVPALPDDLRL
jgi:acyl-CoA thioesterase I